MNGYWTWFDDRTYLTAMRGYNGLKVNLFRSKINTKLERQNVVDILCALCALSLPLEIIEKEQLEEVKDAKGVVVGIRLFKGELPVVVAANPEMKLEDVEHTRKIIVHEVRATACA